MKNNIAIVTFMFLLCIFLYLDNKTYYYGTGSGFIASRLPTRLEIYFAGSGINSSGMVLKENDLNLHIIYKGDSIITNFKHKKIIIQKFIGYWYNDKFVIAKIIDVSNKMKFIKVYAENSIYSDSEIICEETKYSKNTFEKLEYIDLEKSLGYFVQIKALKNISLIFLIVSTVILLRMLLKKKLVLKTKC